MRDVSVETSLRVVSPDCLEEFRDSGSTGKTDLIAVPKMARATLIDFTPIGLVIALAMVGVPAAIAKPPLEKYGELRDSIPRSLSGEFHPPC